MKKVLIAYASRTGNTMKMASYIAEGVRFSGNEVDVKKINEIKNEKALEGYDAYVFGSPTYHRDMTGGMKTFLFLGQKLNLVGKVAGAFGSQNELRNYVSRLKGNSHSIKLTPPQQWPSALSNVILGLSRTR